MSNNRKSRCSKWTDTTEKTRRKMKVQMKYWKNHRTHFQSWQKTLLAWLKAKKIWRLTAMMQLNNLVYKREGYMISRMCYKESDMLRKCTKISCVGSGESKIQKWVAKLTTSIQKLLHWNENNKNWPVKLTI